MGGVGTTVLGYTRNRASAARSGMRSFTIGVIIPNHIVFYIPFLNSLERATNDPSLLFVCNAQQQMDNGVAYLDQLVAKNVDGVLVVSTMVPADIDLHGPGLPPIVFADFPDAPGPSVVFDHHKGSALATAHMLEHGHSSIGFVAPPRELTNVAPKYAGYEEVMAGAAATGLVVTSADFEIDSAFEAAMQLLGGPDRPTAVVAASDNHAIAVMQAAGELGLSIPGDVALIGNDNIMVADLLQPPLSSVDIPAAEMGRVAMAMLQRLVEGESLDDDQVTLDVSLAIRRSCGCEGSNVSA